MLTVLENGESLSITAEQAKLLTALNLIYPCDECGGALFHIPDGVSWQQVESALT